MRKVQYEIVDRFCIWRTDWNLTDNTLLIFMSDNGTSGGLNVYNYGMKGKKETLHEGGASVPLFMRLPGRFKPVIDVDCLPRHYDIFPTLAELASAKISVDHETDGRSLMPLIINPKAQSKDRYTFFHKDAWAKKRAPRYHGRGNTDPEKAKYKDFAVRSEKWRLVTKDPLYDIDADPGEENNVAAENPEVVDQMLAAYARWWVKVRPMTVNEDAPLDSGKPFIERYEEQKKDKGIPRWKPFAENGRVLGN